MVLYSDNEEAVEWVNMCWRKVRISKQDFTSVVLATAKILFSDRSILCTTQMWRVYQRGLERWIADLLQPVFDNLVTDKMAPRFVQASAP
jgi:hypothetical protein